MRDLLSHMYTHVVIKYIQTPSNLRVKITVVSLLSEQPIIFQMMILHE